MKNQHIFAAMACESAKAPTAAALHVVVLLHGRCHGLLVLLLLHEHSNPQRLLCLHALSSFLSLLTRIVPVTPPGRLGLWPLRWRFERHRHSLSGQSAGGLDIWTWGKTPRFSGPKPLKSPQNAWCMLVSPTVSPSFTNLPLLPP